MLFDSRTPQSSEGFKPNVDNSIKKPIPTGVEKFFFILFFILTIGIFYFVYVGRKNELMRDQNEIQNASSLIQAAEKRRRAVLIKMMNSLIGYKNFENETLTKITQYRSKLSNIDVDKTSPVELKSQIDSIRGALNFQFEQYPDLKASKLYLQFSTEISMQEDEIYATIRNYNMIATSFNSKIYTFWTNCVAQKLDLYNVAIFQASEIERADVDTSELRN